MEFSRWRGVHEKSVYRAIKDGRIPSTVLGRDAAGQVVIVDVEQAAIEWVAHTRPRIDASKTNGYVAAPSKLADATLRERNARADKAELETAIKRGKYALVADTDQLLSTLAVYVRTALLGLPTRARQRMPHLTVADVTELDRLVREILEEFADRATIEGQAAS